MGLPFDNKEHALDFAGDIADDLDPIDWLLWDDDRWIAWESEEIAVEGYTTEAGLRWRIVCCNCMAGIDRGWDQSPYPLIELWNTRT